MILICLIVTVVALFVTYVPAILNSDNWKPSKCPDGKNHNWKFSQCIYNDINGEKKVYTCTEYECSNCGAIMFDETHNHTQLDYDNVKYLNKDHSFIFGFITPHNDYTADHLSSKFHKYSFERACAEKIVDSKTYDEMRSYLEDPANKFIGTYSVEYE